MPLPQMYQPMFEKTMQSMGNATMNRDTGRLASEAMAGSGEALQQLMAISPEMGMKIQSQMADLKTSRAQEANYRSQISGREGQEVQRDTEFDQGQTEFLQEQQERLMTIAQGVATDAAKFASFEEAQPSMQRKMDLLLQQNPEMAEIFGDNTFDQEDYDEAVAMAREAPDKGAIDKLRGQVSDVTKTFRQVEEAYERIFAVEENAAGDMAMIFNYMKMLDPGSTVREGEFATAQQTTGIPGRITNFYNNALAGRRLSPDQILEFKGQAQNLFDAQRRASDNQIGNVLQLADQDGVPRETVLGTERLAGYNTRRMSNEEFLAGLNGDEED